VSELYKADGREPVWATLTDARTAITCPVRVDDTVGRVTDDSDLPSLSVADPERYVSPIHLELGYDGTNWTVRDLSLNGTFIRSQEGWQFILSEPGYLRLRENGHQRVSDGRPPDTLTATGGLTVVPVDASYSVRLEFDPNPEGILDSW
jgi:hypothetical protein